MPIEYLITLTYTAALLFMMILCWGIGLVSALRRARFDISNTDVQAQADSASGSFRMIEQPTTGEWQAWGEKRRDNTGHIESGVVLPMRYQQAQLFTEADKETDAQERSPENKAS